MPSLEVWPSRGARMKTPLFPSFGQLYSTSISKSPYSSLVQSQPPLPPLQTIFPSRTSQQSPLPATASHPVRSLPLKIGGRSSGRTARSRAQARTRMSVSLGGLLLYVQERPGEVDHKLTGGAPQAVEFSGSTGHRLGVLGWSTGRKRSANCWREA